MDQIFHPNWCTLARSCWYNMNIVFFYFSYGVTHYCYIIFHCYFENSHFSWILLSSSKRIVKGVFFHLNISRFKEIVVSVIWENYFFQNTWLSSKLWRLTLLISNIIHISTYNFEKLKTFERLYLSNIFSPFAWKNFRHRSIEIN